MSKEFTSAQRKYVSKIKRLHTDIKKAGMQIILVDDIVQLYHIEHDVNQSNANDFPSLTTGVFITSCGM